MGGDRVIAAPKTHRLLGTPRGFALSPSGRSGRGGWTHMGPRARTSEQRSAPVRPSGVRTHVCSCGDISPALRWHRHPHALRSPRRLACVTVFNHGTRGCFIHSAVNSVPVPFVRSGAVQGREPGLGRAQSSYPPGVVAPAVADRAFHAQHVPEHLRSCAAVATHDLYVNARVLLWHRRRRNLRVSPRPHARHVAHGARAGWTGELMVRK